MTQLEPPPAPTSPDLHKLPTKRIRTMSPVKPQCINHHDPPSETSIASTRKVAVAYIYIIGIPTPLCRKCLTEWQRIWDENRT